MTAVAPVLFLYVIDDHLAVHLLRDSLNDRRGAVALLDVNLSLGCAPAWAEVTLEVPGMTAVVLLWKVLWHHVLHVLHHACSAPEMLHIKGTVA